MKSRVLYVCVALLIGSAVASYGQPKTEVHRSYAADGTTLLSEFHYYIDGMGARVNHGMMRLWHANGTLSRVRYYDHGVLHGTETGWNEAGNLSLEYGYVQGYLLRVREVTYHDNNSARVASDLERIFERSAGQIVKTTVTSTAWYADGTLQSKGGSLTDSTGSGAHGLQQQWHPNGTRAYTGNYRYGVQHGVVEEWHANGNPKSSGSYIYGVPNGTHQHWFENGAAKELREFRDGMWHGRYLRYDLQQRGLPWIEQNWRMGVQHGVETWYWVENAYNPQFEPGHPHKRQEYDEGRRTGSYTEWYDDGRLNQEGYQTDAKKCGMWTVHSWTYDYEFERYVLWNVYTVNYGDCNFPPAISPPSPEITPKYVSGRVTSNSLPLGDVTVSSGSRTTTTASNGMYGLDLGTESNHALKFEKGGYLTHQTTIAMGSAQSVTHNVILKQRTTSNLPAVTAIDSAIGTLFLTGVSASNQLQIRVDWNGTEPGTIEVTVRGATHTLAATAGGAVFHLDMGSLPGSLDPNAMPIRVVAVSKAGDRSPVETWYPALVPAPPWSTAFGLFRFMYSQYGQAPAFGIGGTYPVSEDPPIRVLFEEQSTPALLWSAWNLFPFIGGQSLGLTETRVGLAIEAQTDGSGSIQALGQAAFKAGGAEIGASLTGKGLVRYVPRRGLEWNGVDVTLDVAGTIKREEGILSVIPALKAAESWTMIGTPIRWFNGMAKAEASFTVSGGGTAKLAYAQNKYQFGLAPQFGIGVGVAISGGTADKVKATLSGSGTITVVGRAQLTLPPVVLDRVDAQLGVKLDIVVWKYQKTLSASHGFSSSGAASEPIYLPASLDGGMRPMRRDYLQNAAGYSRFVAPATASHGALAGVRHSTTASTGGTLLIENSYPYSEPAIAVHNGVAMILFVYSDPADPVLQASEIYWTRYDGTGYSQPAPVVDDTRAEFAPTLGRDTAGRWVAAWERVKDPDFGGDEPQLMAAQLEIVYAVFDAGLQRWTEPVPLTDNDHLDHSPLLRTAGDGSLLLIWQENPGNELIGTPAAPTRIRASRWDAASASFTDPQTAVDSLVGCFDFVVAWDGAVGRLAWVRDEDGDPDTLHDHELYTATYAADTWGPATRITNDAASDTKPRVHFSAPGVADMVWLRDDQLVRQTGNGPITTVRPDSGSLRFTGFQTIPDAHGRLVLLWQNQDAAGTDIFYAVYDADRAVWSRDLRLTADPAVDKDFQGVFASDGALHLVHNKLDLTQDRTDLYHHVHRLRTDLAIRADGFEMEPAQPGPGESVELRWPVHNLGDLPLENTSVRFYLGDPNAGGQAIGTVMVEPAVLAAGDAGLATLRWIAPAATGQPALLYAVAVASNLVVEDDETNNQAMVAWLTPDIAVVGGRIDELGDGSADVVATLFNGGTVAARNFTVRFMADGRVSGDVLVPALLPLTRADISLRMWPDVEFSERPGTLTIIADPRRDLIEADTSNNVWTLSVVLTTDSDGDGMEDSWERLHFGSLYRDGSEDMDGDGVSDLFEFLAGTDPLDPDSALRGTLTELAADGSVRIAWPTQPGYTYQVQYADSPTALQWTNLGDPVTAADLPGVVADQLPTTTTSRFYRVMLIGQ
jgi:antitoxin component YwqK of YwqJK toxin-antitoxin module